MAALSAGLALAACSADLDTGLDNKHCTQAGGCLAGYACSADGFCQRTHDAQAIAAIDSLDAGPDTRAGDAMSAQPVTTPIASSMPPPKPPTPATTEIAPAPKMHCMAGLMLCGSVCVDLARDPAHCGSCERSCPSTEHANASCVHGACATSCVIGYAKCSELCLKLQTDPQHCGTCDKACKKEQSCRAGRCMKSDSKAD